MSDSEHAQPTADYYSTIFRAINGDNVQEKPRDAKTEQEKQALYAKKGPEWGNHGLNIMDYVKWKGWPYKQVSNGPKDALEFNLGDPHGNRQPGDRSSVFVMLKARDNGAPTRGIYNRFSDGYDGSHQFPDNKNSLLKFVKEVGGAGTDDAARKEIRAMINDVGVDTKFPVANYQADDNRLRVTDVDLNHKHTFSTEQHTSETTYFDTTKKYGTNDHQMAHAYLTKKRGLNPKFVDLFMNNDLIRTNGEFRFHDKQTHQPKVIPPYIEFAQKRPQNRQQALSPFDSDQLTVGADRIFFGDRDGQGNPDYSHYAYPHSHPKSIASTHRIAHTNDGNQQVPNAESDYGFNFKSGNGRDNLFVFEDPIDAMSYYQLHAKSLAKTNSTFLSLSGSQAKRGTIYNFMHQQFADSSTFKNRIFCTDNDRAGQALITSVLDGQNDLAEFNKSQNAGSVSYSIHVPGKNPNGNPCKDWNEELVARERDPRGAVKVPLHQFYEPEAFANHVVKQLTQQLSPDGQQKLAQFNRASFEAWKNYNSNPARRGLRKDDSALQLAKKNYAAFDKHDREAVDEFYKGPGQHLSPFEIAKHLPQGISSLKPQQTINQSQQSQQSQQKPMANKQQTGQRRKPIFNPFSTVAEQKQARADFNAMRAAKRDQQPFSHTHSTEWGR